MRFGRVWLFVNIQYRETCLHASQYVHVSPLRCDMLAAPVPHNTLKSLTG